MVLPASISKAAAVTTFQFRTTIRRRWIQACVASLLLALFPAQAQLGTAFTFQGRLNDDQGPVNGLYDLVFTLLDKDSNPIGPVLTNTAVPVVEGQFVRVLDFGPNSFVRHLGPSGRESQGPGEWLEIAVRKAGAKPDPYVTLTPRQHLMPTPYAAALSVPLSSASLVGLYGHAVILNSESNRVRGQFYGDAAGLSNLPPTGLSGPIPTSQLSSNVALRTGGNAFSGKQTITAGEVGIGTTVPEGQLDVRGMIVSQGGSGNNQNMVFKKSFALGTGNAQFIFSHRTSGRELWLMANEPINGTRELQGWDYGNQAVRFPADGQAFYIDEANNRVGVGVKPTTHAVEVAGSVYSTKDFLGDRLNIGTANSLTGDFASIAGGQANTNTGTRAAIGGGWKNRADAGYSTVGGGRDNAATGVYGAVGGGHGNSAAEYGTVSGGTYNRALGDYSTVPGGVRNTAQGSSSFAAGINAFAAHRQSFIWNGDSFRTNTTSAEKQFEVYAPGGAHFYTGTQPLYASGDMSCATLTIRGGADLAEPFAMSDETVPAGAVVVIDPASPGRLKLSSEPFDRKVAGIVSGAGGVQPGISMLQAEKFDAGRNVALSGRVYALVDATEDPVMPGDLLTTSATPGHAMKAADPARAIGAILGKAMTPLPAGRGLVLVLVSLQ
jgi:hypothetical protein